MPGATLSLFSNGDYLTLDIYQDLIRRGVNRFHITRHSPQPTPAIKAILDYRKVNGDAGVEFHYAQLDKIRNRGGLLTAIRGARLAQCDTPFRTMFINVQGKVVFCCDDYLGTAILGDTKSEKVLEIWKKKHFRKLRQEVRRGVYELDICRKCLEAPWVESNQGG